MNNYKTRITGAAFVAIMAAIVLPAIFGPPAEFADRHGGDPWRNAIYDFQTLITGVLAVAAAAGTIIQMQLADRKSDDRHRQSMELALRGDRLLIQRALIPQIHHIRECGAISNRLYERFLQHSGQVDFLDFPPIAGWWWEFQEMFLIISETIERPYFKDGEHLFDGDLSYRIWELRRQTMNVRPHFETANQFLSGRPLTYDEEGSLEYWKDDGGDAEVAAYVRYCAHAFPGIVEGLVRVGREYGISFHD
ncbi:hypothetical protein [Sinorhizobium meliloti]|uniref:hypothetical protein n=1 Tax=Rhizobium meliloti TaxID=382 RepID=UPI000FD9710C|nr:hypothetical protein [Sinorhizobium meliloti]RVN34514.1 hypothetical protein CN118_22495 [Sinorhizobium meliloti]